MTIPLARVRVLFDTKLAARMRAQQINTFQAYIGEILAHAGIAFDWLDSAAQLDRAAADVLIVALSDDTTYIKRFAEEGGVVIALANLDALATQLGCTILPPVGVGYAHLPSSHAGGTPLRFLSAAPWVAGAAQAIGQLRAGAPDGAQVGAAVLRMNVGAGVIERWQVDVASTVVALQQGIEPVTHDGIPAPDGSAALNEGILKADDGMTLDWTHDRVIAPSGQPYFAHAYADLWREAFVHRLLALAVERGLALPLLDYYPPGVTAVATISHDSDLNKDETAITTLGLLQEAGIHSCWCIVEPGYSSEVYAQVQAAGHELAFHYNAVEHENYRWDAADFALQFAWFKQAANLDAVISNKNHYTRFENWGDLFRWLEQAGIQLDQTRGPSKRGNVGLLFGTCHPFFPIAWHDESNRLYDVLELGFLTQDMDLGSWADSSIIEPFIAEVARVRGVAHFLFHPVHLHSQEAVRGAFRKVIRELRARGFVFWTSQQINAWERARRKARITALDDQGRAVLTDAPAEPVAVWLPVSMQPTAQTDEQRFGVWCRRMEMGD